MQKKPWGTTLAYAAIIFICFWLIARAKAAFAADEVLDPSPAPAVASRSTFNAGKITIEFEDHTPRFLQWYAISSKETNPDARFAAWEKWYGEAAVPPTAEGRAVARRLVDGAWPRYAAIVSALPDAAEKSRPVLTKSLSEVQRILETDHPFRVRVKAIVGAFDGNAFAYRADMPVLVYPLETPPARLPMLLAHEGTHVVHMLLSDLKGQWERTIAATALMEGLAMHVSCEAVGIPRSATRAADCIGTTPEEWERALSRRTALLAQMRPELDRKDAAGVGKYTYGTGNTGLRREAYFAGWWLVEELRKEGMSFGEIARLKEAELPARVGRAFDAMLAASPAPATVSGALPSRAP